MSSEQNYQNHTRWNTLVHFVISPLLLIYLVWQLVMLFNEPNWDRGAQVLIAFTLILLSIGSRLQALTVQNRVIRLEERLRYKEILPSDLHEKAAKIGVGKMIALRFASDEELPTLVKRVIDGELKTSKEIKMAIKNWRADHLRA